MVTITIGNEARSLQEIDAQWINQQINRRRADGEDVCVRVRIQENGVDLHLTTPTCGGGGRGGRQANQQESELIDLWKRLGLSKEDFAGGQVTAFIQQLRQKL